MFIPKIPTTRQKYNISSLNPLQGQGVVSNLLHELFGNQRENKFKKKKSYETVLSWKINLRFGSTKNNLHARLPGKGAMFAHCPM